MDTSTFIEGDLRNMHFNYIQSNGCNIYGGNNDTSYHNAICIDNKLHLIAYEMHGIYDESKQQFDGLNKEHKLLFAPYWVIYVESTELLFAFSDESNNYCLL